MAEEAVISVTSPTAEQNQNSVNATIESGVQGGTESTCNNNNNNAESSAVTSDVNREKSLEYADELVVKGSKASEDGDYGEAVECFSRALEIRVAHFGELAPECINAYYKYGCALLYKAQDEADPLVSLPKKDSGSQQDSNRDGSVKSVVSCESSISSTAEPGGSSNGKEKVEDDAAEENEDEGDEEESDDEDLAEGDEDETDLDLAWKLLDVARAIAEKHAGDTMEKVDVLSALAEVALEREDIETSLSDYLKALSILERLVEPDSRHIAALNFRICLCLEIGSKHQEAIPYCQKAILTCKSRLQRLTEEIKLLSESTERLATTDVDQIARQSSSTSQSDSVSAKEAEVETLTELSAELEKKLEDLQQCMSNPSSILSDILGMVSAKARSLENADASVAVNSSQMGVAHSPRPCLKWKARSQAILTVLKSLGADFLCLQELDEYDSFYKGNIESVGYSSIYVKRNGQKRDGCGIFYKPDSAELLIKEKVEYNDLVPSNQDDTSSEDKEENLPAGGNKKLASKDAGLKNKRAGHGDLNDPCVRFKRDCVGIMAAFRLKDPSHFIIVANTHIYWDPELADVKLAQARYLLSRLAQFKLLVSDKFDCSPSVVVTGDFNSLPGSQVYQYLTSGSSEAGTLLEISDDVHIPLCSAYASTRGEPHFTNYTPGFTGTLDYILFSPENIKPVSYLELPEPEASDIQGGLPNYYHPSDHLPIGAEFEIIQ